VNNDYAPVGRIARFESDAASHVFFEKVRGGAPVGFAYGSPYFAERKGGVVREYTQERPGEEEEETWTQGVLGARWAYDEHRFGSAEEAERMYEGWELELYKGGARLKNLEWMKRLVRDE
jgi:hypothetical protein